MFGTSDLVLIDYKVERMHFDLNRSFVCENDTIELNPIFTRKLTKVDESSFMIQLGVKIDNVGNLLPFGCEIVLSGRFSLHEWQEINKNIYVLNNTCAILFPYLRNVLFTVTMNANVPPYVLPVMNVVHLFKDEDTSK